MEVLNILEQYNIISIGAVLGIVVIMSQLRKLFLDTLIAKISNKIIQWLIYTVIAFIISSFLTSLIMINEFNILTVISKSIMNWIFSWIFHDTVKNLFLKKDI